MKSEWERTRPETIVHTVIPILLNQLFFVFYFFRINTFIYLMRQFCCLLLHSLTMPFLVPWIIGRVNRWKGFDTQRDREIQRKKCYVKMKTEKNRMNKKRQNSHTHRHTLGKHTKSILFAWIISAWNGSIASSTKMSDSDAECVSAHTCTPLFIL